MSMKTPPHPGRIVRQECIEALGLTVTAAAKGLGVTRKALSELVAVISAPDEFRDLPWKKEEQSKRIEKIVKEPDHEHERAWLAISARCRNKTSVAP